MCWSSRRQKTSCSRRLTFSMRKVRRLFSLQKCLIGFIWSLCTYSTLQVTVKELLKYLKQLSLLCGFTVKAAFFFLNLPKNLWTVCYLPKWLIFIIPIYMCVLLGVIVLSSHVVPACCESFLSCVCREAGLQHLLNLPVASSPIVKG